MHGVSSGDATTSHVSAYEVEVYYDGDCPLCLREIQLLQRMDRRNRIRFTNIADPNFDTAQAGLSFQALMEQLHGRLPDGTRIEGVEVFRRLYAAVGLGPLVALTRLPGVSHLLELGYRLFARNRLRLTGRCMPGPDGACSLNGPG